MLMIAKLSQVVYIDPEYSCKPEEVPIKYNGAISTLKCVQFQYGTMLTLYKTNW